MGRGFPSGHPLGTTGTKRLDPDAVGQSLRRRAAAGLKRSFLEQVTPYGMCAGCITTACRNQVPVEEIMAHSEHRSPTRMRSYIRRAKLSTTSPSGKLDL